MNNPRNIESKVEQTLASLDQTPRAKANPFLHTRVMASLRKEERSTWSTILQFVNRPVIALSVIVVVLVMNVLVILQSTDTAAVQPPLQEQEQIFASEYNYPQTTADRFYSVNDDQ